MIDYNKHFSTEMKDKLGRKFNVGDKVVRAKKLSSRAVDIDICTVTKIDENSLYLDDSKVSIVFPGRLLIVTSLLESLNE